MKTFIAPFAVVASALILTGCAGMQSYSQEGLPSAVQVPMGQRVAMQTIGKGEIRYECKAKKDMVGQYEWAFVGPDASLSDRLGNVVGKYYGPPATWESNDGSKITGTQLAVAPAGSGNIPSQLVKANPAVGSGAMSDVTYIQRVATMGGVAPAKACNASAVGAREMVPYQADYIFWKQA